MIITQKKIRGIKRKMNQFFYHLDQATAQFPKDFYNRYWHLHLPVAQSFIEASKTTWKMKQSCMQALLLSAEKLEKLKPDDEVHYRVVVLIDVNDLWDSQIIIFQGEEYFNGFFNRNGAEQKWQLFSKNSLLQQWNLKSPTNFHVCCYKETCFEDDNITYEGERWFIGELT